MKYFFLINFLGVAFAYLVPNIISAAKLDVDPALSQIIFWIGLAVYFLFYTAAYIPLTRYKKTKKPSNIKFSIAMILLSLLVISSAGLLEDQAFWTSTWMVPVTPFFVMYLCLAAFAVLKVALAHIFSFFWMQSKQRIYGVLFVIFVEVLTLSLLIGYASNGMTSAPLMIATHMPKSGWEVRKVVQNLQWYDHFFIVSAAYRTGYPHYVGMFKNMYYSELGELTNEEAVAYLKENKPEEYQKLQEAGICEFQGEEQIPHLSVRTATYFGIPYKNFLVTCNYVEYSASEGIGARLPREK